MYGFCMKMKERLLSACQRNVVDVARELGADCNCRDDDDLSGLHIAARDNYGEMLELLLAQSGVDVNIRDSGDRRVNWNIKNSDGDTPVMYCLKNNKIEMARCLINTPGVDLDTVDRDGKHLETIAR